MAKSFFITQLARLISSLGPCLVALVFGFPTASLAEVDSKWELVFEDSFERDQIGGNWIVVDGDWTVEGDHLEGSGILVSEKLYPDESKRDPGLPGEHSPGFHRLEIELQPVAESGELRFFLHAPAPVEHEDYVSDGVGYTFVFSKESSQILKRGEVLWTGEALEISKVGPDATLTLVMENDDGILRISLGDEVIIEETETFSIVSHDHDRIGFHLEEPVRIKEVRLWVQYLPDAYY